MKRVLVVEDHEPTQKLIEALMRRDGLSTTIVSNGLEALQAVRDGVFDVMILDLMMPGMAGMSVIESMHEQGRHTPIVVCSAAGTKVLDGLDRKLVRAVIRKPFDIDELSSAVAAAMRT